jgi:hypothetical protein
MGLEIETGTWRGAATSAAVTVAVIVLALVLKTLGRFLRSAWMLRDVPGVPGCNWALGHVWQLTTCVRRHVAAWDQILEWVDACPGPLVKFRILGTHCVAFSDPVGMKRVFQSAYKIYEKDLALSYAPFLPILGTGLVTANGDQWQQQRTLMGPALRVEVLDDIIYIAKKVGARVTAWPSLQSTSGSLHACVQRHATPCNAMQRHAAPCSAMQRHATSPCSPHTPSPLHVLPRRSTACARSSSRTAARTSRST